MNNMKRVAVEILGLEWDDEKGVSETFTFYGVPYFINEGGRRFDKYGCKTIYTLEHMIINSHLIIKQPWKPKYGESYYFADVGCIGPDNMFWIGDDEDVLRFEMGLIAKTQAEAQKKQDYYTKLIKENPYKEGLE